MVVAAGAIAQCGVMKTVDFLSGELLANPDHAWSIGPLGHALHSLMIYHERLYNEPALPAVSQTAAEPLKTKPVSISALSPPGPECDNGFLNISQLQRAAEAPKSVKTSEALATPPAATAKEIADRADGCTDAIPPTAAIPSGLKVALRDIISAIVPEAATATPVAVPADSPRSQTDAPFDRPGTSQVGP